MTQASTRLVRLLNMVPYFQANPGVTHAAAAADLGVSVRQLRADLNQLWLCGLPGYGPGDLIDLEFSGDTIDVTFSAGIDRPLRLTTTEAAGVSIALRALVDIPGMVDPAAALSALAKIEAAGAPGSAGSSAGRRPATPAVRPADPPEDAAATAVRTAVRTRRAVRLRYHSASHDAVTERVVDPLGVVLVGSHSYLHGWCRTAEGTRLFRFDRIEGAEVLDAPSAPPPRARDAAPDTALFDGDPSLPVARLRIAPSATWLLDYYPVTSVERRPDGGAVAALTYGSLDWMARQVLGFGGEVEVLDPPELAARVGEVARAALAAYDDAADHLSEPPPAQSPPAGARVADPLR